MSKQKNLLALLVIKFLKPINPLRGTKRTFTRKKQTRKRKRNQCNYSVQILFSSIPNTSTAKGFSIDQRGKEPMPSSNELPLHAARQSSWNLNPKIGTTGTIISFDFPFPLTVERFRFFSSFPMERDRFFQPCRSGKGEKMKFKGTFDASMLIFNVEIVRKKNFFEPFSPPYPLPASQTFTWLDPNLFQLLDSLFMAESKISDYQPSSYSSYNAEVQYPDDQGLFLADFSHFTPEQQDHMVFALALWGNDRMLRILVLFFTSPHSFLILCKLTICTYE